VYGGASDTPFTALLRGVHAHHVLPGSRPSCRNRSAPGPDRQRRAQRVALQSQHHRRVARQEPEYGSGVRQRDLRGPRVEGRHRQHEDFLSQSADAGVFEVLDKNGTDGEASFELPAPGSYTVWARALGKPGGSSKITTCATNIALTGTDAGVTICSTLNEVFVRGTGKSNFRNVTTALTTITLDPVAEAAAVTACGGRTTVNLFDSCLLGFFWQYDNNGLKLLQVRFYPNPA